jgi:hypothetical protein
VGDADRIQCSTWGLGWRLELGPRGLEVGRWAGGWVDDKM